MDTEIWIGTNRLYVDDDNILHVTSVGDIDEKVTAAIEKLYRELMEVMVNVRMLIDLNQAGKACPAARKLFAQMAKDKKIKKVASFGLHPVARVVATFGMGVVYRRGFAKFFTTEQDALKWLNE